MCGLYPAYGDETYTLDSTYYFYDSSSNTYSFDMPVERIYPHTNYGNPVVSNVTLGATQYQLTQSVEESDTLDNSTVLGSTVITGTRQGWMSGYKQTFKYLNPDYDKYQLHFNINQRRGGITVAKIYYYSDNGWVLAYTDNVDSASYSTGDIGVEFDIRGWMVEVEYTFNSGFAFLRADDQYSDGYRLNDFAILIKDSQTQAEETQDKIEENTRNTNTILGTVKNAIDNVKIAIDNVVTGIANLPTTILNGLKDLFIPDDFTSLLTDNISDLTDSLGFLGFPLAFINDLVTTIIDSDSLVMAVSVPSIGSPWGTLFPGYTRSNILYWVNYSCFSNLGNSSMFSNLLSILGLNYNSSIVSVIHSFTNIALFLALLRLAVNKYNDIFGADLDAGGDDD